MRGADCLSAGCGFCVGSGSKKSLLKSRADVACLALNQPRALLRYRKLLACAVLDGHKMRTPIQCDSHGWRPRALNLGQVDSVQRR